MIVWKKLKIVKTDDLNMHLQIVQIVDPDTLLSTTCPMIELIPPCAPLLCVQNVAKSIEIQRTEDFMHSHCCPHCGPQYRLQNSKGSLIKCENPIEETKRLLKEGNIIAIKGIGGYHLVCNAQDENAIATLEGGKIDP